MLKQLFTEAARKAGGQEQLGEILGLNQSRISEFKNYKGKGRKPSDALIGEIAEYVNWNPLEVILLCKIETDKENEELWRRWGIDDGALGGNRTHDPRLRRARVVNQMIDFIGTFIQLVIKQRHIAYNQGGHSALSSQCRHVLTNL